MRWLAVLVGWPSPSFGTYALPFCHERFAARTSKTGKTSTISSDMAICFFGKGMVPNSQRWQTFLTRCPWEAEQFTLNLRQTYDSMLARRLGKAQHTSLQS
jgi:hypothetical protein